MSKFEEMLTEIDSYQNKVYDTEFNISKLLLSDQEAVKKLIKLKSPAITDEDIDLMVDDEETSIQKLESEFANQPSVRIDGRLPRQERQRIREEKEKNLDKIKQEKRERIKEIKRIYKDKLNSFYDEVKLIKNQIKEAFFKLSKEVKELGKRLSTFSVQVVNSIPGIALIILAPPFNIPSAISQLMMIIDNYLELISKLKNTAPLLTLMKSLPVVVDPSKLNGLSTFVKNLVKLLNNFWTPISSIDKVIKSLLDFIKRFLSNNKSSIFRKSTKKLIQLGHLKKENSGRTGPERGTFDGYKVRSYDVDDVEEVLQLLKTFKVSEAQNKVVGYNEDSDKSLSDLDKISTDIDEVKVSNIINESDDSDQYIYDIELPDGSVVKSISEEGLEYYKELYTIKFVESL